MIRTRVIGVGVLGGLMSAIIAAAPQQADVSMQTLTYASPGGQPLVLDLYEPSAARNPLPVIVFLHGGGWSGGTRTTGPDFARFFARDGFAMVSIEYRLTPAITFPSNVEDVKTAIRWLRAHAAEHRLDPNRIGLWGTSAGATLGSIAALSPPDLFEGDGNRDQSSAVQCVLDAYGPILFTAMDAQTAQEKAALQPVAAALATAPPMVAGVVVDPNRGDAPATGRAGRSGAPAVPGPHDAADSAESRLVGAPIQTVPEKVRAASPLTYVTSNAPPFLIMHGLADNSVPHGQSVMLYEALTAAGNDVTLRLVDGLPHTFFNRTNLDELAGPFRMDVRTHEARASERASVDRAGVFDVARAFFVAKLHP